MNGSYQVGLNGSEVWAYVVEVTDGVRLRPKPATAAEGMTDVESELVARRGLKP